MRPSQHFNHCPRCGQRQPVPPFGGVFECPACHFTFYFNAAIATAAFIARPDGCLLFVVRAKDPEKGKLAPPGGFVDIGEPAEEGIRREVREEVGLEVTDLAFLCSQPNEYPYKEVVYPVLDLFFTARAVAADQAQALDDVAGLRWIPLAEVKPEEVAFASIRAALAFLKRRN